MQGCTRIIRIFPTHVILPPGVEVEHARFIEVDLTRIPIESLQMVQTQDHEELKECELIQCAQNEKLQKENDQLQLKYRTTSAKLAEKEEEECMLKTIVVELCMELPQCHIDPEDMLMQTMKVIVG